MALNLLVLLILSALVCGFQTTFLPATLPFSVTPGLWILPVSYVAIYRRVSFSVAFAYLNSILLTGFTGMPLGILLVTHIVLILLANFARTRIFWPTLSYFLLLTLGQIVLYQVCFILLSRMSEPVTHAQLSWRELFASVVFVPIFSPVVFWLGRKLDQVLPVPDIAEVKS